jgi:hydroxyacylglutathione hydrolase
MEIKRIIVGQLSTNCYLLVDDGQLAIIDPGDETGTIESEISKIGAIPQFIINTHCHFDHIGANGALKEKFHIPVLIAENEKGSAGFSADKFLKDGQELKIGGSILKIIDTPGHTKGSICLFGDNFVFSGDTIFAESFGRTDLPGGSDKDMRASLQKLDCLIKQDTTICPGHGDTFNYQKGMTLTWLDYLN